MSIFSSLVDGLTLGFAASAWWAIHRPGRMVIEIRRVPADDIVRDFRRHLDDIEDGR